jgi:hypothetical protein
MGRDNIGADDDPADNGPLRYIARGARVLTADDEANPDALALYDGPLGHATDEQHSINVDATSARIGFCNFTGWTRFAAVALTSSSQVSIADRCFVGVQLESRLSRHRVPVLANASRRAPRFNRRRFGITL